MQLKKKYLKVKSERNFLKQGLKAIEVKTDKLVQENLQLKKGKAIDPVIFFYYLCI